MRRVVMIQDPDTSDGVEHRADQNAELSKRIDYTVPSSSSNIQLDYSQYAGGKNIWHELTLSQRILGHEH